MTAATAGRLTVLAEYRWPEQPARELPVLPGYVLSSFSPLVAAAVEGCLGGFPAGQQPDRESLERTAVLLVTAGNDVTSAEHVRDRVAAGRRLGPLLFFQIAPNSVVGHLTGRWGLAGPVLAISPVGDPLADGLAEAELLLDDGDAEQVLLVLAEQADPAVPDSCDRAHALLLTERPTS